MKATKSQLQQMYDALKEQQMREPYDLRFRPGTQFEMDAIAFCKEKQITLVPEAQAPAGRLYLGLHLEP